MQEQDKTFQFYEKNPYLFAEPTLKNRILVSFVDLTIISNLYNLSYTWSFSTKQSVLVSSFPSLSY